MNIVHFTDQIFVLLINFFIINSKELDKIWPVVIQESIQMLAVFKPEPMKMFLMRKYF